MPTHAQHTRPAVAEFALWAAWRVTGAVTGIAGFIAATTRRALYVSPHDLFTDPWLQYRREAPITLVGLIALANAAWLALP